MVLYSHYVKQSPTIDGILVDWSLINSSIRIVDREIDQGGKTRVLSDNKVEVWSAWNSEHLYLAFEVQDQDLRTYQTENDHSKLYLDDMVEFLIDANHNRGAKWLMDDFVYHINLLGAKKDDRGTAYGEKDVSWNGVAYYKVKISGTVNDTTDIDGGYGLEVAIPWEEIGRKAEEGLSMGLNVANGDNDGKGRQLFDWCSAWPIRSPQKFGVLKLIH